MLDIAFLEQVLVDLAFAGRIENLFLDLRRGPTARGRSRRASFCLRPSPLRFLEFLEQLLDLAVILLQQRDRVLDLVSAMTVPPVGLESETNCRGWMFLGRMRHETVTIPAPTGIDWEGLGYLTSIVSVFFLGAIAWPKPRTRRLASSRR